MKMVKILHCADIHFDTPFQGLTPMEAQGRKEDLRETFGKVIEIVKKQSITILLIAGDLFDHDKTTKSTLEYIINKFEEIEDVKVFISPGNHDPYTSKSFYSILTWPSNVHIFKNTLERVYIPELNTCVYGIAFSNSHEKQCLIQDFHVEDKDAINIMVVHGDVIGKGQATYYNPIKKDTIENSGLDYLALGHKHGYSGVCKVGATHWAYAGNPEGRGFDELGVKGILLGEVGKGHCRMDFLDISKRKYWDVMLDISGVYTYEEIVCKCLYEINVGDKGKDIYRITLIGELDGEFPIFASVLKDKLNDDFYRVKIEDRTKIALNYSALEEEYSLKGIFARKMREKIVRTEDEDEKMKLEESLKLGLRAMELGKVEME